MMKLNAHAPARLVGGRRVSAAYQSPALARKAASNAADTAAAVDSALKSGAPCLCEHLCPRAASADLFGPTELVSRNPADDLKPLHDDPHRLRMSNFAKGAHQPYARQFKPARNNMVQQPRKNNSSNNPAPAF